MIYLNTWSHGRVEIYDCTDQSKASTISAACNSAVDECMEYGQIIRRKEEEERGPIWYLPWPHALLKLGTDFDSFFYSLIIFFFLLVSQTSPTVSNSKKQQLIAKLTQFHRGSRESRSGGSRQWDQTRDGSSSPSR